MSKQILILAGSPRKNGNSAALCRAFARGAEESGHQVETVFLRDKKIGYCLACYHCKNSGGTCIIKDDMADILDKMNAADVIVMASPVYFYSIDAQMKALIDRTVAQWLIIKNKEFYYIMTAAEESDTVMDCTLECFRGLARDEKSRTFSSNSRRSYILRTSSRSIRLILSSIVSLAVSLKWTRTI